ncbi:hypothetical protein EXIGLDRAFT_269026 [Exidia glandulosa HHB12029]|uniref:Uncharacterized protein n=1 Tax=Exidia glandulosa HHB12029 TaxID=1314781 RepID=A0A165DNG2_EXIGL|nr:hypothetical protein EXIGLDRAFT_269026 [Exidia glandulosa HHB12029]
MSTSTHLLRPSFHQPRRRSGARARCAVCTRRQWTDARNLQPPRRNYERNLRKGRRRAQSHVHRCCRQADCIVESTAPRRHCYQPVCVGRFVQGDVPCPTLNPSKLFVVISLQVMRRTSASCGCL